MSLHVDADFADLEVTLEELQTGPPVELDGEPIPEALPQKVELLLAHNPKMKATWESGAYPSPSEQAYALMFRAGLLGLTKSEAAALHVAHYARRGRREDGLRKAPYSLRAWSEGRVRAEARDRGAGNGPPAEPDRAAAPGREPESGSGPAGRERPGPPPAEAPEVDLPDFPSEAYLGLAAEFAGAYSEHLEAPPQFLYLDYLTFLGAMLAAHVRLDTQLREEPRLYTVKVAESALGRKSSSQDEVEHFFAPLAQDRLTMCYGAGSAEGLAKRMESRLPTILVCDEFRAFVDKANVQQSVLLPMVATLFSRTVYENATKHSEISLKDAHLSLVAACTRDTFVTMFSPSFRAIGFLNRLLIVAGRRGALHPIPGRIPDDTIGRLRERTREQIERAEQEKPLLRFSAEARARWEEWYRALPESPYCARLDTYGLRLLMLFAMTTESGEIGKGLVDAAIALLDYEYRIRLDLDPVDAETTVARLERLILRHLRKGLMTEKRLRDFCHARQTGLWAFDSAMKNLGRRTWLASKKVRQGLNWWLTDAGLEAADEA